MTTMTPPPPSPPPPPPSSGPRVTGEEMRDLRRLRRTRSPRTVAGVAGGIARHVDVDPIIVKVLFVVLTFFVGAGLLVYGACWLLVPEEGTEHVVVRVDERSRTVALVVVGVIAALALVGDSFAGPGLAWPLVPIGILVVVVLLVRGSARPHPFTVGAPGADAPGAPGAPGTAGAPAPGWVGAAPFPVPTVVDTRRRGPVLFWFAAALAALAVGVLGVLEAAGLDLPASVYPAAVLACCGAMLLVGAFWGRAGGLIAVGLVAALATAVTTAFGQVDGGQIRAVPATADDVASSYSLDAGEIRLDLSDVEDVDDLDGRRLDLDVDLGQISLVVPDDLTVEVHGHVEGAGQVVLFGDRSQDSLTATHDAGPGAPVLVVDATVGFGEVDVTTTDSTFVNRTDGSTR